MQLAGKTRASCSVNEILVAVEMPKAHLYISLFVQDRWKQSNAQGCRTSPHQGLANYSAQRDKEALVHAVR